MLNYLRCICNHLSKKSYRWPLSDFSFLQIIQSYKRPWKNISDLEIYERRFKLRLWYTTVENEEPNLCISITFLHWKYQTWECGSGNGNVNEGNPAEPEIIQRLQVRQFYSTPARSVYNANILYTEKLVISKAAESSFAFTDAEQWVDNTDTLHRVM